MQPWKVIQQIYVCWLNPYSSRNSFRIKCKIKTMGLLKWNGKSKTLCFVYEVLRGLSKNYKATTRRVNSHWRSKKNCKEFILWGFIHIYFSDKFTVREFYQIKYSSLIRSKTFTEIKTNLDRLVRYFVMVNVYY